METENDSQVIVEVPENKVGDKVGVCKWFNNVHGYGFLTIVDGPETGTDVFVHHSGIKPSNSQYKTLKKGEYLTFDIVDGAQGSQAINVRGINGGPLLCDHIPVRKNTTVSTRTNGWTTVSYKNTKGKGGASSPPNGHMPPPPPPPIPIQDNSDEWWL